MCVYTNTHRVIKSKRQASSPSRTPRPPDQREGGLGDGQDPEEVDGRDLPVLLQRHPLHLAEAAHARVVDHAPQNLCGGRCEDVRPGYMITVQADYEGN